MDSDRTDIMENSLSPQSSDEPAEEAIEAKEESSAAASSENFFSDIKDTLETMVSKIAAHPTAADW